jgi:hypothetical protein
MQVDNNLIKQQISDFVVKSSHLGLLIDPKSDSSVSKVVQQLGFVGLQLYREGKFYSSRLVEESSTQANYTENKISVVATTQHKLKIHGTLQIRKRKFIYHRRSLPHHSCLSTTQHPCPSTMQHPCPSTTPPPLLQLSCSLQSA